MRPLTPEDYSEIWSRRKWWFFATVFLIAAGTAIVAALLPREYTSECLILLEGQPVGADAAAAAQKPGGDTQTEQQLSTLIEQTLSRTRLEQIMRDAGQISPTDSPSDTAYDTFRDKINIEILKDKDPRHPSSPYGFKISYTDHKPKNAQRVTNELASFFVSERLRSEEQTARESNQYLQSQLDTALKDVNEKQQALTDFKKRYNGQLPVDEQLNVQSLVRLQTQLQVNQQAIERAREEITAADTATQNTTSNAAQQSPDSATAKLSADLGTLKSKLADLLSRDTPTHPDVIKTRAEIARVEAELASEQATPGKSSETSSTKSNAKVSASNQDRVADARAQIAARTEEQKRIEQEIQKYQDNLQQIPIHAEQYAEMDRAYQDSKNAFDALKKKVDDSTLANDMVIKLQGQRFRIQDFASLPDSPTSPVYWKINLGGLGAAFLFGVVLVGAVEFGDTTMKSDRDVEYYLQTKNLATLPTLALPPETQSATRKKRLWMFGSMPVVLAIAAMLGYLYLIRK
jgi:polysaccharide chain length determinant protein (PEP-CTERM system associated)